MLKQNINYSKCLFIGAIFEIVAVILLSFLLYLNEGFFLKVYSISGGIVTFLYLLLQGFFVTLLVVLVRDKIFNKKLQAGIFIGLLMWFFNGRAFIILVEIAGITISFLSTQYEANEPAYVITRIISWLTYLIGYIALGEVLIYLVDKIYFSREKLISNN